MIVVALVVAGFFLGVVLLGWSSWSGRDLAVLLLVAAGVFSAMGAGVRSARRAARTDPTRPGPPAPGPDEDDPDL